MCNPTPSPAQASTSSQSSGARSSMPPPSPASTHTGMAATNSPTSSGPSRPRSITRGHSAPILKLVASLRNSEDRDSPIRRMQRPPSPLSITRDMGRLPTRTPTPTRRRMIFRRPFHGEESRDDSQGRHYHPQHHQQQQQQQEEEEQTGNSIPFEEEDEDEIPGLIDEDQEEEDLHRAHRPWDDHQRQRRTRSLPREPLERIAPSPFASLPSGNFHASLQAQQSQPQQPPKKKEEEDAVPFFLLDKMLEDLVPDHQNAQDLARILHEQQQESQFARPRRFSQMRKTKSVGSGIVNRAGTRAASPIIRRLLPWTAGEDSKPEFTAPSADVAASTTTSTTAKATHVHRPLTPPPTRDEGMPPMPVTPKSSNRKNSKLRQKQRKEALIAPKSLKDNGNENGNDHAEDWFVPRNLDISLEDCETAASAPAEEANSDSAPAASTSPLLKLIPRLTSKAPKALATGHVQGNSVVVDAKATTKKSASCPQLYQEEESSQDQQEALSSLRQRAKEQHHRRERRNKQTVIQRSLTLAQGWNNKGLSMAGRATHAEQFGTATRLGAAQPQHAQPQHSPDQWWESSLECWDNALEIYRSLLGEYHERVADVQNNRGIALGKLKRFDEALVALGMAVEARKKQEERAKQNKTKVTTPEKQEEEAGGSTDTPASAAIVSTLHNIANVFRDAGNPSEALRVLVEAQDTLAASETDQASSLFHRHHCWHQSARLSTAIGHIYYESESWREARDAYGQALEVYEKLSRSLSMQSEKLGWGNQASSSSTQQNNLATGDPHETRRLQLLHHRQLIQREVSVLERDLDELDRCQQAKQGSRARLLQARKQQHQQHGRYETTTRRAQQQAQQQQPQQQPPTLLGIVSSLRA